MQISPFEAEIESLYGRLVASPIRSLVITSAVADEGVSCTAQALTHRLLLAGNSALLVDLNIFSPSLQPLIEDFDDDPSTAITLAKPSMVTTTDTELVLQGVGARNDKALMTHLRQPQFLQTQIQQWLQGFDYVIIDAPPLLGPESDSVPADHIASVCDACLLVVLSCSTPDRLIMEGLKKLREKGITPIGCVLNDQFNPPLKAELLRELERLPHALGFFKRAVAAWIHRNRFLSMDV